MNPMEEEFHRDTSGLVAYLKQCEQEQQEWLNEQVIHRKFSLFWITTGLWSLIALAINLAISDLGVSIILMLIPWALLVIGWIASLRHRRSCKLRTLED